MYKVHHKNLERPLTTAGSIKSTYEVYFILTSSIQVLLENRFIKIFTCCDKKPYSNKCAGTACCLHIQNNPRGLVE